MPRHEFVKAVQRLGYDKIVGVDEVGRGALAGPVVVGAVELNHPIDGINDSKLLTGSRRTELAALIARHARQISFGQASNEEIDQLGLGAALKLAYHRCLDRIEFDLVLTDHYALKRITHLRAVRGDSLFYPVAAASIVAKVYRDQLMSVYHQFHPQFNWRKNVGYGTLEHRQLVNKIGPSPLHRRSFLS